MRATRAALNRFGARHALLLGLVVVALVIRLGFFLSSPHPYESSGLVANHGDVAHNIVSNGRWFVLNRSARAITDLQHREHRLVDPDQVDLRSADAHPDYAPEILQTPGLALVLAAFWWITGDQDYAYAQVLQILIDSAMVLLVFWASRRLFGRMRAALVAAGLYAVFLPLASLANIAHLDTWAAFFALTIFCLFLKARDATRRWLWLAALGVATGASVYFRPFLVILPLALMIASALGTGWRRSWALGVVPAAVAVAFMTPWTVRNYNEFHQLIPMRSGIGLNLWEGLGELPNNFGAVTDDQVTAAQVSRERPNLHYGTPAFDNYLFRKARRVIEHHPGFYAEVVGRRFLLTTALLRNYNWTGHSRGALRALKLGLATLLEPLLFLFAITTAAATCRRFWRQHLLLLAVPLAVIAPYVFLHAEPRYALPGSFAYMILFGFGIDLVLERGVARREVPRSTLSPQA
jgi:4-amino-4-deoxy-L-arabinose transferase-like glycosyltransferase